MPALPMLRSIGLARLCHPPVGCFQRALSTSRKGVGQRLANQLAENLTYEMHPGARLYVINQKNPNNHPARTLEALKNNLLEVKQNDAVGVVIIKVKHLSLLTSAENLGGSQQSPQYKAALTAIDEFPTIIEEFDKPVVVIYCDVVNTAFSAFSAAKYRLATPESTFQLKGLQNGHFPIGGDLVRELVTMNELGSPLTRFMGISEKIIRGEDLYAVGLATHFTENDPEDDLLYSLAHTPFTNFLKQGIQEMPITVEYLDNIINTLNCECEDLEEMENSEEMNELMTIPFSEYGDYDARGNPETLEADDMPNILDMTDFIMEAFKGNSPAEVKHALRNMANESPAHPYRSVVLTCLQNMDRIPQPILKNWFYMTRPTFPPDVTSQQLEESALASMSMGEGNASAPSMQRRRS